MAGKKTQAQLTPEEKLQQALVPEAEQPYKVPANWCWTRQNIACYLSDIEKIVNGEHPYLEAKFLRGLKKPKIVSAGKFINKSSKVILVDGENSGEVFDIFVDGYMGSTFRLLCFSEIVYEQYCRYFIIINKEIYSKSKKGSAIPHLNKELFFNMPFPLPPLVEQQRIVERIESLFAKLDEAKENLQNVLDGFETRKAAILHKAFTGELTAKWRKQHGVSIDSWEEKKLEETSIEIIDGDRGINYPKKEEFTANGYCVFLNTKNVTVNGFNFDRVEFISKSKDDILRKGKLKRGDIVLTTRGTIGNIALYDENIHFENMRINSGMVIYRNGNEFFKHFLIHLYKSRFITKQIKCLQTGSAQPQLPIKIMKNLKLIIPTFSEQIEIVRIIDDLLTKEQQAKELAENALAKVDLIKKAILAHAFRGKLGTNNPADEPAVELLKQVL